MTDEEFLFWQDCTEKKRTAIGAHHKVTHGGRVMMPSDYLTKKEKEAMNSEVTTFKLDEPRNWIEFLQLSDEHKMEYLTHLYGKYNPSQTMLAKMFGVSGTAVCVTFKKKGLPVSECKGKRTAEEIAKWDLFIGQKTAAVYTEPCGHPDPAGEPGEPGVAEASEVIEVHKISPVDPKKGMVAFDGNVEDVLVAIRRMFAGNPNLNMKVTWEVIE